MPNYRNEVMLDRLIKPSSQPIQVIIHVNERKVYITFVRGRGDFFHRFDKDGFYLFMQKLATAEKKNEWLALKNERLES